MVKINSTTRFKPEQVISYLNESLGHFNQVSGLAQERLLFLLVSGASRPALIAAETIPLLHTTVGP